MSLVEVLISSLLLASSSSAALGVWSQSTATLQQSSQLQQKADALRLLQIASHRWLQRHGAAINLLVSASEQCLLDANAVASASAQDLLLPQGMTRQWVADPEQLGVWQELSALNGDGQVLLQRRQLFSPAAYGLCQ